MTHVFTFPGSGLEEWLEGMAWFWRLGAVGSQPSRGSVGFAALPQLREVRDALEAGELAGAVVFAPGDGEADVALPRRRTVSGIAKAREGSVRGEFTIFETGRGTAAFSSSLGDHAVISERMLLVGADPVAEWGRLDRYWVFRAVLDYLADSLATPIYGLPAMGALRLDDVPATAQHQLEDRAKSDRVQRRRIRSWIPAYRRAGSVLNVAVTAQALDEEGERVPLDRIWPDSIRALADGVAAGAFEPVCHGLLHLDTDELAAGRVEFREFGQLGREQARERIAAGIAWQERHLRRPPTFVAPAWIYGEGGLPAARALRIPAWLKPQPGPMVEDGNVHETLIDGPLGHNRLDFRPLAALAAAGIPPTVVFHGTMLDGRFGRLSLPRDLPTLARLSLRRDIVRLPAVKGVSWIGAGELFERVLAHSGLDPSDHGAIATALGSGSLVQLAAPAAIISRS